MMEQQTTTSSLRPEIWGRVATREDVQETQGYVYYASRDSRVLQGNPSLGYLSALVQGLNKVDSRRFLSGVFKSFYKAEHHNPLQALHHAAAHVGDGSFPEPEIMLLAVLQNDRLYLAQLGQGGAYLIRQNVMHPLLGDQSRHHPDFYRPIILEADDRVLLCNLRLQSQFDRDTQERLATASDTKLIEFVQQLSQTPTTSLVSATITSVPESSKWGLSRWHMATWIILSLVALLQFAALLLLR